MNEMPNLTKEVALQNLWLIVSFVSHMPKLKIESDGITPFQIKLYFVEILL